MNLRLFKAALFLLLLGVSADAFGQREEMTVIKDQSATFSFLSRYEPTVGRQPENGTVTMVEDPIFNYTLTYTPDPGYVGGDDFLLVSFPFGVNVAFTQFEVSVEEAIIQAKHDAAYTAAGTPVTIPVTSNDFSNTGDFALTAAPVVNAGTVEIVGDEIVFTPNPGFSGLTDFNYVICTLENTCDLGTVSVTVTPEQGGAPMDTVRVFTNRDQAQFIFAPEGATPLSTPEYGEMTLIDGVMAYAPHEDFVGEEYLAYASDDQESPMVFHITVLDLRENEFAEEDRTYTTVDAPVTLNVLHNDLYSVFADCVEFGAPEFGVLVNTGVHGQVTYHPPAGWSGVDQFTYTSMAPGCEGEAEEQTVYVFVSNFAPDQETATLTTPVGVPLDLTYSSPGGNASWSVVEQPSFGLVITDPVTGKLRYTPLPNAVGQTDVLTLEYCLSNDESNGCEFSSTVEVSINVTAEDPNACLDEDCVWPGDTNNDGVVDVGDLLPIGLAMGQSGTPRLTANPGGWGAQYGEDWDEDLNGVDLKHVDANGDQIISSLDTQVVMNNLGLAHRLRSVPQNFTTFELSLSGTLIAEPGDRVVLDIVAGNSVVITEDVYGFIFPFTYDPRAVDASGVDIVYGEDSWASYDSPILSLTKNDPGRGRIQSAFTRTNGEGISGFGKIGELSVVITEDVYGFIDDYEIADQDNGPETVLTLGGETAAVMNGAGHMDAVHVNPFNLTIRRQAPTEVADYDPVAASVYLDNKLQVYPNPTSDRLVVHLNGQQKFTTLTLTDITGRTLRYETGLETNHRELRLGDLPNGIYTLSLTTDDGVVNRKVEVVR
ncbi:Ig-like domain-containing protein [Lewinella sp. W8]|uniref:Ig-like domain-containing protein n=1 Tax=Lewinella sp. W8 TaxID=2528208 RepID=UPI00106885D7|nr:Ig-like domain-containing protein [Lewinella sp. W8]MTB49711.1 T9SS type A sorting domain-containing protein [Lewinella sp. W8]